jgi:hypothetical protein
MRTWFKWFRIWQYFVNTEMDFGVHTRAKYLHSAQQKNQLTHECACQLMMLSIKYSSTELWSKPVWRKHIIRCAMFQVVPASSRCLGPSAWNMYRSDQRRQQLHGSCTGPHNHITGWVCVHSGHNRPSELTEREIFMVITTRNLENNLVYFEKTIYILPKNL